MTQIYKHQSSPARFLKVATDLSVSPARMIDDEAFARQLLMDDPGAGFSWLFRRYHALLCNHSLRFVYNREVAEDIVGEVFCTLWTERGFERITSSYRAYLFRAVRYRSLNYLRWEFSRQATSPVDETPAGEVAMDAQPGDSPADLLQFDELCATIDQTIAGLPPQCRRVFMMSRFEQKTYRHIADELGISIKAVEANVSRALSTLRRVLNNGFLALLMSLFI